MFRRGSTKWLFPVLTVALAVALGLAARFRMKPEPPELSEFGNPKAPKSLWQEYEEGLVAPPQ